MRVFLLWLTVVVAIGCNNPEPTTSADTSTETPASTNPANIDFTVNKSYPHDATAFTEGLQYQGGNMLESTGLLGKSDIRRYELATGKILQKTKLDNAFFGEGCTQLGDKVYQLTYKQNTCLVYDAATLKKINSFTYNFGEGWGLTNNGKELIMSNGGNNLFFFDPVGFKELRRVGVSNQYGPVGSINELEWVNGFVYANIWQRDLIVKIHPETGEVLGQMDLADLRIKANIPAPDGESDYVLNGIAYDSVGKRLFVTGKNWPLLFELGIKP
jgi:glutamine cyclotransferase